MTMKWEDKGFKHPMARARGLGSARTGTVHWIHERLVSIPLVPLLFWLVWSLIGLEGAGYEGAMGWLSDPLNAVLLALFVVFSVYHAMLGLQVVIEDYVTNEGVKITLMIVQQLTLVALGVASVFSILRVAL